MYLVKKIILSILLLCIFYVPAISTDQSGARKYFVAPLINKDYYLALREAIQSAKKSIKISMFVITRESSPSGPVNAILLDLIEAQKRGVKVRVILECPKNMSDKLYNGNSKVIEYLRENGIEADFDVPEKSLHEKFVLVDDSIAFIGAHNFSRAALKTSNETSIVVKSEPPDPAFAEHFSKIKIGEKVKTREEKKKEASDLLDELMGK